MMPSSRFDGERFVVEVMVKRAAEWLPACDAAEPELRALGEHIRDVVAPAFLAVYELARKAGCSEERAPVAVYALLDAGLMDPIVECPLRLCWPYIVAELKGPRGGLFALGWRHLAGPAARFTARTLLTRFVRLF